jgi:hypothetical protein
MDPRLTLARGGRSAKAPVAETDLEAFARGERSLSEVLGIEARLDELIDHGLTLFEAGHMARACPVLEAAAILGGRTPWLEIALACAKVSLAEAAADEADDPGAACTAAEREFEAALDRAPPELAGVARDWRAATRLHPGTH